MAPPIIRKKRTIDRRRSRTRPKVAAKPQDNESVLVVGAAAAQTNPTVSNSNGANNDDNDADTHHPNDAEQPDDLEFENESLSSDEDDESGARKLSDAAHDQRNGEKPLPPTSSVTATARKKTTIRSRAAATAPKRKTLTLARQQPAKTVSANKHRASQTKKDDRSYSSDDELSEEGSGGDIDSQEEESNVSEFEPNDDNATDENSEGDDSEDSWDDGERHEKSTRPTRFKGSAVKPASTRTSRNGRRNNSKKQRNSTVAESSSGGSEEEEILPTKKRATSSRSTRAKRASRRKKNDSDQADSSSSDDQRTIPKNGKTKRPAARTRRRGRNASESEHESSDSDVEDEEKIKYNTPAGTSRRNSRVAHLESSEDEDGSMISPRRSTPSRRSATRALSRIHDVVEKDENVEKEERSARKRKKTDDDEEFDPEASDTPEEGAEDSLDDDVSSSALSDIAISDDGNTRKAGNVDEQQDFLTADSTDDENTTGPSPMLEVKYTPRSRWRSNEPDDFGSSSESENDLDQDGPMLSSSPHMPACPTELDAVTNDPLPEKHLCFFPPDQNSRQCFALETLHKIAMNSSVRGPDGKRTFLQPPHFRTPASDDFIDQIASRFGRSALELSGDFYRRGKSDVDGYTLTIGANLANEERFRERLNSYMSNLMGSQDAYCCPLCYIESHRKLVHRFEAENGDSTDESEGEEEGARNHDPIKLWHDPMTVLGFLDNEEYKLASTFCFTKVADVKRHLRDAHNVDTKVIEGNDMYARFKVRAADGLLQRYIDAAKQGRTFQGDMRRYWNLGNNASFVYLLHLMERRNTQMESLDAGEDYTGEAFRFFDDARDFCQSFDSRAQKVWDTLSAPYRKGSKEELKEFIEEGDMDEDDSQPHFLLQRQMDDFTSADEIAEALKQRRRSHGGEEHSGSSSDNDSHDGDGDAFTDEDSEDYAQKPEDEPGYYSEEEEETDEWVTSKLARRHGRAKRSSGIYYSPSKNAKRLGSARGNKNGQLKRDLHSPDSTSSPPPTKKVKRQIIIDSDSSGDE